MVRVTTTGGQHLYLNKDKVIAIEPFRWNNTSDGLYSKVILENGSSIKVLQDPDELAKSL